MSDTGSPVAASTGSSSRFSDREIQLLGWAMQSLKGGAAPDIDYDKLAAFASMTNSRSASNAWAKIKKKLITTDGDAPPSTPTKKAATPRKKRTPKAVDENGEPPKKSTPRKRPAKKQEVEDGDVSPKKKSRAAKGKKSEEIVDESDDVDPPVKSEDEADATNDELTVKAEVEEDENEA